ncbi:hypothetical protein B9479_000648 [Cryptococcus floricola]|uniref:Uncharacterized protein n=1 Tax=Cryptococcus floricola TaxID=2591691 RepID=A0A5D3B621_9TREE|nr:hypothetical protein B9479_000648 [Cryptococcus floricola]
MTETVPNLAQGGATNTTNRQDHSDPELYQVTSPESAKVAHAHDEYHGGGNMSRFITPGGSAVDNSQPAFPVFHRKFANPSPLGLLSFASSSLLLNLYQANARGVTTPNVILGMAIGVGGMGQTIAGILEWGSGNTFAATTFVSYGGFWWTLAWIYMPQFGIAAAYADPAMLENALGLMMMSWGTVTFLFVIAAHRSSVALLCILVPLTITFYVTASGYLMQSAYLLRVGGVIGCIMSMAGFYCALAGLLTPDTSYFMVPVGNLAPRQKPH